ncbi:MAG: ribosomal protein S18-alanine N-acetyltransferase [Clostridiales bacterium]|nr:ribosomal protein S18-alanine N-acetyltransferase [Clostridiales bacterium]
MRLERITPEDCAELAELDKRCFAVPWSEKSFREETENSLATYVLAKEDGKIIGYCGFWKVYGEVQVTNIAVLPEYRHRGVASALIDEMLAQCEGEEQFVLEVRASNSAAVSLYEKYGFKRAGVRRHFYRSPDEDGIVMIRREN